MVCGLDVVIQIVVNKCYACGKKLATKMQYEREIGTHHVIVRSTIIAALQVFSLQIQHVNNRRTGDRKGLPTYLYQVLNPFLDVERIRLEATCEKLGNLVDKVVVRHVFAILHDTNNTGLAA